MKKGYKVLARPHQKLNLLPAFLWLIPMHPALPTQKRHRQLLLPFHHPPQPRYRWPSRTKKPGRCGRYHRRQWRRRQLQSRRLRFPRWRQKRRVGLRSSKGWRKNNEKLDWQKISGDFVRAAACFDWNSLVAPGIMHLECRIGTELWVSSSLKLVWAVADTARLFFCAAFLTSLNPCNLVP